MELRINDKLFHIVIILQGVIVNSYGQSSFPPKNATQSKTWWSSTADKAIDNYLSTCSLAADLLPCGWWQVDLGGVFTVFSVTVLSGNNDGMDPRYLQNFSISVTITNNMEVIDSYVGLCYYFNNGSSLAAGTNTTFNCTPNPLEGRYVTIKRRGGYREDAIGFCDVNIRYDSVSTSTRNTPNTSPILFGSSTGSLGDRNTTESLSSTLSTMDEKTKHTIICVVVIIGGLLLFGGAAVLIYFLIKKYRGKLFFKRSPAAPSNNKKSKIEILPVRRQSTSPYTNLTADHEILTKLIRENDLAAYVEKKKSDPGGLKTEFKKLPEDESREANFGRKSEHKSKNRFANVLPYDHTLVPLEIEEFDDPEGNYINANYISGYRNAEKMYIATQGPKPNTLDDFWRMIWQQNVNLIVMFTSLIETGKKKCEQYWPDSHNSARTYHKITVTLTTEEVYSHYAYREMVVHDERKDDIPPRTVRQMHFLTWSDKTRPDHFLSILSFRRKVRLLQQDSSGPVVVHCSAGIGRTGTYIALDILLEQLKEEHEASIFGCVKELRHQRMGMVQTSEQYMFLHEALADGVQAGDTGIPCASFIKEYVEMAKPWPDGSLSNLEQQFVLLKKLKDLKTEKYSSGFEKQNIYKNRDRDIVAYDDGRPFLESTYYNGTDYINAVYSDSYRLKDAFVLTQWPLQETVVDFWRLVWDYRLRTIVLLNVYDPNDESCPSYWPIENTTEVYGPFEVEVTGTKEISSAIHFRELTLTNTKEKRSDTLTVQQFEINSWPNGRSIPENSSVLLELINVLMASSNNAPMVVQCIDGASRSGLFAAAMYLIDMMKVEQVVDVFFACRFVAINRPQVVSSMEQYTFLHDLACTCLMQYEEYGNCKPVNGGIDEKWTKAVLDNNPAIYANASDSKLSTVKGLAGSKPIKLGEF